MHRGQCARTTVIPLPCFYACTLALAWMGAARNRGACVVCAQAWLCQQPLPFAVRLCGVTWCGVSWVACALVRLCMQVVQAVPAAPMTNFGQYDLCGLLGGQMGVNGNQALNSPNGTVVGNWILMPPGVPPSAGSFTGFPCFLLKPAKATGTVSRE